LANPVETLGDVEALFALMRSFRIGIVELPGMKFVLEPEAPQIPARQAAGEDVQLPVDIASDPMLYGDGIVPSYDRR
jgi:hypothetical protein